LNKLTEEGALRQYRHNNSDEFVFGYDIDVTDKYVAYLEENIKSLKSELCAAMLAGGLLQFR
jgi:hypothetical protein